MRTAFPVVSRFVVELTFEDPEGVAPAAQSHALYPPARAFFEFPCPYANCDGKFDLGTVAKRAISHSSLHATGTAECSGVRTRDGVTQRACGIRAVYAITAEYDVGQEPPAEPTSPGYLRRGAGTASGTRVKSTMK